MKRTDWAIKKYYIFVLLQKSEQSKAKPKILIVFWGFIFSLPQLIK